MSVEVWIPTPFRDLTGGVSTVVCEGKTVLALIESLDSQYEGMMGRLCDEQRRLRRYVNISLNDEDIRFLQAVDTLVRDGDSLKIVPAIAGG